MSIQTEPQDSAPSRWGTGFLIAVGIAAVGIIASLVLRAIDNLVAAFIVVVAANLVAAFVMDRFSLRDGVVFGAMTVLMAMGTLPLRWVPDQAAWMRENPLTLGVIILIAGYMRFKYEKAWPLYAVAAILGVAHILISLI